MFWPYHDWLYTNQYSEGSGAFTKDRLKIIGQLAGIRAGNDQRRVDLRPAADERYVEQAEADRARLERLEYLQ